MQSDFRLFLQNRSEEVSSLASCGGKKDENEDFWGGLFGGIVKNRELERHQWQRINNQNNWNCQVELTNEELIS